MPNTSFLIDSNKVNTLMLKFSIPAVKDGMVKPSPFVSKFFQILQKTNPTAQILPKSNAAHLPALMTAYHIPNDAKGIADYASDVTSNTMPGATSMSFTYAFAPSSTLLKSSTTPRICTAGLLPNISGFRSTITPPRTSAPLDG